MHESLSIPIAAGDLALDTLRQADESGGQNRAFALIAGDATVLGTTGARRALADAEAAFASILADEKLLDEEIGRRREVVDRAACQRGQTIEVLNPLGAELIGEYHRLHDRAEMLSVVIDAMPFSKPNYWQARPHFEPDMTAQPALLKASVTALENDPEVDLPVIDIDRSAAAEAA